jgi:hypothetical protein
MHKGNIKQMQKENLPAQYFPADNPGAVQIGSFATAEIHDFIDYVASMKEPVDFLKLVEDIGSFKHRDDKMNLFEYYLTKYIKSKPKLFVYGSRDIVLKAFFFMPWNQKRLETFYNSCGNAEIVRGSFSHMMNPNKNQVASFMAAKDEGVTEIIVRFLDKSY